MKESKKIGLVLSGGGYRGVAHIGVLKAMDELGVKPDYISGTSAGAIIGALYAEGHSWQEILNFFTHVELLTFQHFNVLKPGLIDGITLEKRLSSMFKENSFESLNIPMFVATTDLIEGKNHFFHHGELIRPIIASASVPGVFAPIPYQDYLLCDGGVTNNFPIEPLEVYCDTIIGVYVNPLPKINKDELKTAKAIINRSYAIGRVRDTEGKFRDCDVFISPGELGTFTTYARSKADAIFELGYKEAKLKLSTLF